MRLRQLILVVGLTLTSCQDGIGVDVDTTPKPGDEARVHEPFTSYDVGPPEAVIPKEALSPAERLQAESVIGRQDMARIHAAYSESLKEVTAKMQESWRKTNEEAR